MDRGINESLVLFISPSRSLRREGEINRMRVPFMPRKPIDTYLTPIRYWPYAGEYSPRHRCLAASDFFPFGMRGSRGVLAPLGFRASLSFMGCSI